MEDSDDPSQREFFDFFASKSFFLLSSFNF